jgi:glycosyltransferase involved in cell wall biosynthesis
VGRQMKLLFIAKYPPIQGGESAKLYWLAKAIAAKGHQVTVVSNWPECDTWDRCIMNPADWSRLNHEGVTLLATDVSSIGPFIPSYDPKPERLINSALRVVEEVGADIVIGWYLLPYAFAAFNVAQLTSIPLVIQHAGSDMSRLLTNDALEIFLSHMLREAARVFTYDGPSVALTGQGVVRHFVQHPGIPAEFAPHGDHCHFKQEFGVDIDQENVVLFLGKINKSKAFEQLLQACVKSSAHLLAVGGGKHKTAFIQRAQELELANITWLDYVPPWRVPALMRSVRAILILEVGASIPYHRSALTLEALRTATPAIVSNQIADSVGELGGLLLSVNPHDTTALARAMDVTVSTRRIHDHLITNMRAIESLTQSHETYVAEYIDAVERVLQDSASRH